MTPTRIQLSRAKGWRLPPDTVHVARPSRWGNPFISSEVHPHGQAEIVLASGIRMLVDDWWSAETVVQLYSDWMRGRPLLDPASADGKLLVRRQLLAPVPDALQLLGKHLACWCKPGTPCHADVLLRINAELSGPGRRR